METNELLEISTNTFLGLKRIQEAIPTLEKQAEKVRKNLSKSEDGVTEINESISKAKALDEEIDKKIKSLAADTEKAIKAIKSSSGELLEIISQRKKEEEASAGSVELMRLIEENKETIGALVKKVETLSKSLEKQQKTIQEQKKKIDEQGKTIEELKKSKGAAPVVTRKKITYGSARSSFPNGSLYFTMANAQSVTKTKPYGIAIEGKVIREEHWTDLLLSVIPYCFKTYGGDADDLCNMEYGFISDYSGEWIPYFESGFSKDKSYKYIVGSKVSAYYAGADSTVAVLKCMICEYCHVDPANVEIFYHTR